MIPTATCQPPLANRTSPTATCQIPAPPGAVCAEQLYPYLQDARAARLTIRQLEEASGGVPAIDETSALPVEASMMPVIARFDGVPTPSSSGDVVYRFPELLRTSTFDSRYGLFPVHAPIVRGVGGLLRSLQGPTATDYLQETVVLLRKPTTCRNHSALVTAQHSG